MNPSKLLALLLALVMLVSIAACDKPSGTEGDETTSATNETTVGENDDTTEGDETTVAGGDETTVAGGDETSATDGEETTAGEEEIKVITIAEALELCGNPGDITSERYYIRATIKTISNAEYGSMVIYDETGEIAVYEKNRNGENENVALAGGEALLVTYQTPAVLGVAVVCEGGADATVRAELTALLRATLGVDTRNIHIAPLK